MTVMRPFVAFVTAAASGIAENLFNYKAANNKITPDLTCPVDGCCDGVNCSPEVHKNHHTFLEKLRAGFRFAVFDLWADLAAWFFVGLLLAGLITVLIPDDVFSKYLGTGLPAMLLMLAVATRGYYISESTVYRILKANDLITSPVYTVVTAQDKFPNPTRAPNELWQTDFTWFKVVH